MYCLRSRLAAGIVSLGFVSDSKRRAHKPSSAAFCRFVLFITACGRTPAKIGRWRTANWADEIYFLWIEGVTMPCPVAHPHSIPALASGLAGLGRGRVSPNLWRLAYQPALIRQTGQHPDRVAPLVVFEHGNDFAKSALISLSCNRASGGGGAQSPPGMELHHPVDWGGGRQNSVCVGKFTDSWVNHVLLTPRASSARIMSTGQAGPPPTA